MAVAALTPLIIPGLHSPEELTPVTSADGKWPAGDPFVGVLILDGDGTYNLVLQPAPATWFLGKVSGYHTYQTSSGLSLGVSVSSVPEESTLCP